MITQSATCNRLLTWHNSWRQNKIRFTAEFTVKNQWAVRCYWGDVIVTEVIEPTEVAARTTFERKVVAHYKES